jgi:hypothetical protein
MTGFLSTLEILQKNKIFLLANDLWKYNSKLGVSNIIWPQANLKNQTWYNNKKNMLIKSNYNYRYRNKK